MLRAVAAALIAAVLVAPAISTTPAAACATVRVPTDTRAELAAIRKALAAKKLGAETRQRGSMLLAQAESRILSDIERAWAVRDAMKLLGLSRIFKSSACPTVNVPEIS